MAQDKPTKNFIEYYKIKITPIKIDYKAENLEKMNDCFECYLAEPASHRNSIVMLTSSIVEIAKNKLYDEPGDFDIDYEFDIAWQGHHNMTLLLAAAAKGYSFPVFSLVKHCGADVNKCTNDGWSPLHFACMNGNDWIVKLLLKKKANYLLRNALDQSALDIAYFYRDQRNNSSMICKFKNTIQMLELLINRSSRYYWL